MKQLDKILNRITMYRLVVYALSGYAILAVLLALLGKLSFSPTDMVISLTILLSTAYAVDRGLARLFKTPSNTESWLITALILFFVLQPGNSSASFLALGLAGAVSSASKYLIGWNGKHIFNPAAFAAALVSLLALQPATWWIGSTIFWPFTLLAGLAIVRKTRQFPLVVTFGVVSVVLQIMVFIVHNQPLTVGMKGALFTSPLIFLATIMLTEPATMPPRRKLQYIFATMIAILYVTAWRVGSFYIYPEVALLIGNLYAFAVSPKFRVRLTLKEIQRVSEQVYSYVFQPDKPFNFLPGQYMEWTLAGVPYDSRGNRRTFTIASSPTEDDVQLGLKYYQSASMYKATFAQLQVGDSIYASQLGGNFTLDMDAEHKLAYIAGGIGITPFRSMVKYLLDNNIQRDVVLLYVVSHADELAYNDVFLEAKKVGVKYIPIVTNTRLDERQLVQAIPDYRERIFYISGPSGMVDATKSYLHDLHVLPANIKTDHFSGY